MNEIETLNKFLVAMQGPGSIVIMRPAKAPIPADDALLLAAYLVSMAEPFASNSFEKVLEAVQNA